MGLSLEEGRAVREGMNGSETLRSRMQDPAFAGSAFTARDGKGMRPQPERRATLISPKHCGKGDTIPLRYSCDSHLLERGQDIDTLQELMGHRFLTSRWSKPTFSTVVGMASVSQPTS